MAPSALACFTKSAEEVVSHKGLFEAPSHERLWIQQWAFKKVPSIVSDVRKSMTLDIAYAVLADNVPGDCVETGAYTGGTSILLMKALHRWDAGGSRLLWAADSFEGLPAPTEQDSGADSHVGSKNKLSPSEETFINNLKEWEAHGPTRLRILRGWFSETLPTAPIEQISYLRLDRDIYASAMDSLRALYHMVSVGGYVYVDDYGSFDGCRRAIDEFRAEHGITDPLVYQYLPEDGNNEAVAWRKTK
ncbi:hypothetical protein HDU87_001475 [Geranomyces variabilis]|uniref:Macrocin O-methyltransferase n=1 Tax=Geranomyces variabilis TaxID=109894 RepID=A0AAD5TCB8_9FUNG|nr:hypothetical protein HDU87_001475 [Geranomyces variabilis]